MMIGETEIQEAVQSKIKCLFGENDVQSKMELIDLIDRSAIIGERDIVMACIKQSFEDNIQVGYERQRELILKEIAWKMNRTVGANMHALVEKNKLYVTELHNDVRLELTFGDIGPKLTHSTLTHTGARAINGTRLTEKIIERYREKDEPLFEIINDAITYNEFAYKGIIINLTFHFDGNHLFDRQPAVLPELHVNTRCLSKNGLPIRGSTLSKCAECMLDYAYIRIGSVSEDKMLDNRCAYTIKGVDAVVRVQIQETGIIEGKYRSYIPNMKVIIEQMRNIAKESALRI